MPPRDCGVDSAPPEQIAAAIEVLDIEGRLVSINRAGLAALAIDDAAPLVGQAWSRLWPGAAQPDAEAAIAAALRGQASRFTAVRPTADAEATWWEVTVMPVAGSDGSIERLLAASCDVTELKRSRERLAQQEEFLRDALEFNPHMFWMTDAAGIIQRVNSAGLRFIGLSQKDAAGTDWLRCIHPDDQADYSTANRCAVEARSTFDHSFRLRARSGEYRWVRSRAYPKLDGDGGVVRWFGYSDDVHDQKRALDALDERERHLRAIQETLPECVKIVSVDGRLLDMNPAGLAMIEADTLERVEGISITDVVVPSHRRRFSAYHRAAAKGAEQQPLTFEIKGQRGTRRWVESRSVRLLDTDGKTAGVLSVTRDVTDKRRAEAALAESEEHHRLTVELAPQIPFVVDAQGNMLEISSRWTEVTGQPREAGLGAGWLSVTHPDDAADVQRSAGRSLATGEPFDVRSRKRLAGGGFRWFRSRAFPRFDSDGRILCWYGYAEDIDDAVRAEEALRRSEERLQLITSAAGIGIHDSGADGIAVCSPRQFELYGLPHDRPDFSYAEWFEMVHPDDRQRVNRATMSALKSGGRIDFEFRIRRADTGELRWIDSRGNICLDEEGRLLRFYGAQWDITERKSSEAELNRLQAQALQASRLNAMGAMATTLAHELNQPLAAAANYVAAAQMMVTRGKLDDGKFRQVLDAVTAETLRAGGIIRKLRGFVTNGVVASERVAVAGLVARARKLAAGADARMIVPHVQIAPDADMVLADVVQIEQVLSNLLRNAGEALARVPSPELRIDVVRADERSLRISVADNGPGVASEAAAHLFSPFASSKPDGMGVGLSICRTIVEAHGGRIWHETPCDGGAIFAFTLPCGSSEGQTFAPATGLAKDGLPE